VNLQEEKAMRLNAHQVVKDTLLAKDTLTREAQGNLKADKVCHTPLPQHNYTLFTLRGMSPEDLYGGEDSELEVLPEGGYMPLEPVAAKSLEKHKDFLRMVHSVRRWFTSVDLHTHFGVSESFHNFGRSESPFDLGTSHNTARRAGDALRGGPGEGRQADSG